MTLMMNKFLNKLKEILEIYFTKSSGFDKIKCFNYEEFNLDCY